VARPAKRRQIVAGGGQVVAVERRVQVHGERLSVARHAAPPARVPVTEKRREAHPLYAGGVGLPVSEADPASDQWRLIWRLWTKYFALGQSHVYEGRTASQIWPLDFGV
jgi:hypothetical protein